jgi:hypothetical protein
MARQESDTEAGVACDVRDGVIHAELSNAFRVHLELVETNFLGLTLFAN